MPIRRALRFTLPLALVGLTILGAAGPALAGNPPTMPPPEVELIMAEQVVLTPGGSTKVPFEVVNVGEIRAAGLIVEFNTRESPIDERLGFFQSPRCQPTYCEVSPLLPGARTTFEPTVSPTEDFPELGLSFTVVVRDGSNSWQKSATVKIVRPELGVALEVAEIADLDLPAGKSAPLPVSVRNAGTKAAEGFAVALTAQPFITFPEKYSNCRAVKDIEGVVCVFNETLAPNQTFTVSPSTPLTVAADPATPGPASYSTGMYAVTLDDETNDPDLSAASRAARQPGNTLELVPTATAAAAAEPATQWNDATSFFVKVPLNAADSAALGGTFTGKVGASATVKVGFRNDGPATVLPRSNEWVHTARVRIPSGLKLTAVDDGCVPYGDGEPNWTNPGQISGHDYLCIASTSQADGDKEVFSFTGKIENGRNEDAGTITVLGGVQDTRKTNNEAAIKVKVTAAGGSGSGNGTGSGTGTSAGTGGGLPITGAPAGRVAGLGLLLVLTGALALVLTRRRETA